MGWKDEMLKAMTRFVQERRSDCVEVYDWREGAWDFENSYGYTQSACEIDFYFKTDKDGRASYNYDGSFYDLIDSLTEE